jgi:hypothetical protein
MSILGDLGTKIGAKLKSITTRVDALENAPVSSPIEHNSTPSSLLLGNQDWSNLLSDPSRGTYNATHKGVVISGSYSSILDKIKFNIDPNKSYRYTIRVKKLSGSGTFYAGVSTLDANSNMLHTDNASSYNYGTAHACAISIGSTRTFSGVYSGYNTTGGNDKNKFDPEGHYFNLEFICNYGGSGDTVIESIELETISYHEENYPHGKVLQVKNIMLTDDWATTSSGFVTAMSTQFDNPIQPNSKVLVRSTGHMTCGPNAINWGAVIFLGCDNDLLNRGVDHGNHISGGATDMSSYASGGNQYAMEAIVTPSSSTPTLKLVVNKNSTVDNTGGWTFIKLGYSSSSYGHTTTSLTIMEIGE